MASTSKQPVWPACFHWWIDAVGGFLTFTKPVVRIGQIGDDANDVAIMGDLSRNHAELRRADHGVLLIAHSETTVNDIKANTFLLKNGDKIRMRSVEFVVHQPVPASSTIRLTLTSRHRMPLSMDGVLLLGETCVLGPRPDAHVRTTWQDSLFVNWSRDRYWLRGSGKLKIDGKEYNDYGPLEPTSEVSGKWGAFRWEPADTAKPN